MPHDPARFHAEQHFVQSALVRDVVLGAADGLTVPFALAAGLAGAIQSTGIVVTAGLAEIAAGAIAMGLGGYLAAKADYDHYQAEYRREQQEVIEKPDVERMEIREIFAAYGLKGQELENVVNALASNEKQWIDFMMRYELGLEKPEKKRALVSSATIGSAYLIGGLIPLSPYILLDSMQEALNISVIVTLLALLIFGAVKGRFTGINPMRSGLQTALVGGIAASVAYFVATIVAH